MMQTANQIAEINLTSGHGKIKGLQKSDSVSKGLRNKV